jgi:CRISPR type III-associated protein (TIGR04423 family)
MKISMEQFWENLKADLWVGYIWRVSDKDQPMEVFSLPEAVKKKQVIKVFNRIQEANLYCPNSQKSLHVKLIDGNEQAYLYNLENYENDNFKLSEEEVFLASKSNLNGVKFRSLYQLIESPVSQGAKSWIQVAQIFVGFKISKNGTAI